MIKAIEIERNFTDVRVSSFELFIINGKCGRVIVNKSTVIHAKQKYNTSDRRSLVLND